jgi:hypothetical protein
MIEPMLDEFGLPSETEGVLGIQIFKASRGYAEPTLFEASGAGLNGVRLRLGVLPDEYLQLCALAGAQVRNLLSGVGRDAVPFADRLQSSLDRVRAEFQFATRPMAALLGWRATSIRRREPLAEWDWVDFAEEHARGEEVREEVHAALDRVSAVLSLGLGQLLEDRVATHTFWIAPNQRPVRVLREEGGSLEEFTTSHASPPRGEIEQWIHQVSRVPPALYDLIVEPLGLLAAARALEPSWRRFTLGWAVLDRLARNVGKRFDDQIVVDQRKCRSCGADVTARKPGVRQRVEELMRVLDLPELDHLVAELKRVNDVRGDSHGGDLPDGSELLAPERLASVILRAIVDDPGRVHI